MRLPFLPILQPVLLMLAVSRPVAAQQVSVPPDSSHWKLEGNAKVSDYLGRRCLLLDGGAATVTNLVLRDGVIDVDVATAAIRGFIGTEFRGDSENGEIVYLRPHKSGLPDALQYTPILNTGFNWQLYNGPGFTGALDIPRGVWLHLRLVVSGAQARLYVQDLEHPALEMPDLKSGNEQGEVALVDLTGAACFSNVAIRSTPDAPWERHLPLTPTGTLTRWTLSPSYDALARNLERPLSAAELEAISWQPVETEPPGLLPINRYRESPHPRVSFQGDFAKRLDPQTGMRVVYARTHITAQHAEVKKLDLGYSDDVSVFLNGRILYRGRSAQGFRDPGFLGIVNLENDAIYLPLERGENDLVLAVSELGGGWGLIARLEDVSP